MDISVQSHHGKGFLVGKRGEGIMFPMVLRTLILRSFALAKPFPWDGCRQLLGYVSREEKSLKL